MTHVRNGRPWKFDPLWYPELIRMTEESLDKIGFGPETIQVCDTHIYTEKFLLTSDVKKIIAVIVFLTSFRTPMSPIYLP